MSRKTVSKLLKAGTAAVLAASVAAAPVFAAESIAEEPAAAEPLRILIAGVDQESGVSEPTARPDSIILVSIDDEEKQVKTVSFMEALDVDIEGSEERRLSEAYKIGGPELLVSTVEDNFGVEIDHYACLDYDMMIELVDALGGIELNLSSEETEEANKIMKEIATNRGEESKPHIFRDGGGENIHCDGYRTMAYSRIVRVGEGDYERTRRQRTVLKKIVEKFVDSWADEEKTVNFAKYAFETLKTDMTPVEAALFAAKIPSVIRYDLKESRIPYDELYEEENGLLKATQPETNLILSESLS